MNFFSEIYQIKALKKLLYMTKLDFSSWKLKNIIFSNFFLMFTYLYVTSKFWKGIKNEMLLGTLGNTLGTWWEPLVNLMKTHLEQQKMKNLVDVHLVVVSCRCSSCCWWFSSYLSMKRWNMDTIASVHCVVEAHYVVNSRVSSCCW